MIFDLSKCEGDVGLSCDILIIGAGIAGLSIANALDGCGRRIAVMESGGLVSGEEADALNDVDCVAAVYHGARTGRTRGFGGTSAIWGGALLPFAPEELRERPYLGIEEWPVSFEDLSPFIGEAEALFGLSATPYDALTPGSEAAAPASEGDFIPRYAKWPGFRRRNLAVLLKRKLTHSRDIEVWLNATVCTFVPDTETGRIAGVVARSLNGRAITATCNHIFVCAGAIESTRLALLLDTQIDGRISKATDVLGKYFHDHLSAAVAKIEAPSLDGLNRLAGFRYEGRMMRSFRLEFTAQAQRRFRTAGGFAHISFQPEANSGFGALRDFMRSVQRGSVDVGTAARATLDAPYLAKAAYWRFFNKQLYWPRPSRCELNIVAEQLPDRANRITLSSSRDALGVPKAVVDWRIRDADVRSFRTLAARLDVHWRNSSLMSTGRLVWQRPPHEITASDVASTGEIYHPGGTTRMGSHAHHSIVSGDLVMHQVPNLRIVSTSVFPTGGSANPTMTLILLALRLASSFARADPVSIRTQQHAG